MPKFFCKVFNFSNCKNYFLTIPFSFTLLGKVINVFQKLDLLFLHVFVFFIALSKNNGTWYKLILQFSRVCGGLQKLIPKGKLILEELDCKNLCCKNSGTEKFMALTFSCVDSIF